MHLGVGVEQVPFFDFVGKQVTAELRTTVGVHFWRSDLTKALIWVHDEVYLGLRFSHGSGALKRATHTIFR